jgi:WD40 repeat protein
VLLWDLRTGQEIRELAFVRPVYDWFDSCNFTPDGKWVAALKHPHANPGWIGIWETTTGKEVRALRNVGQGWQWPELAFHPDSGSLVTPHGQQLQHWDLTHGTSVIWQGVHAKPLLSVAYSGDGQQLASGDEEGVVCVWDATTRKPSHQFRCNGAVWRVRFSPDGATLAATTATPDSALYLWYLQTRTQTRVGGHSDRVKGLAWQPNGQGLATASDDGTVCLRSLDVKQPPRTFRLNAGMQGQLAFTPEGRHLVTANEDGSIFVLRLAPAP